MRSLGSSFPSSLVIYGHLYTLCKQELMKYDAQKNDWIPETILPTKHRMTTSTAKWWGHVIFPSSVLIARV